MSSTMARAVHIPDDGHGGNGYTRIRVTSTAGGSIEFSERTYRLREAQLDYGDEGLIREIAHLAWCKMFAPPTSIEKHEARHNGGPLNRSAQMLKALCDELGTDAVKKRFSENITWEFL